eukprot:3239003-Pyramimonas_sp.AAC.1
MIPDGGAAQQQCDVAFSCGTADDLKRGKWFLERKIEQQFHHGNISFSTRSTAVRFSGGDVLQCGFLKYPGL